jgi:cell division protein FtsI (penicillin-binding protein 3)
VSARRERRRVGFIAGLFGLYFAAAVLRVFDLCVWESADLRAKAESQHLRTIKLQAERGPIVDRNGDVLALTIESAAVFADPKKVGFGPEAIPLLAKTLGMSTDLVRRKVKGPGRFNLLLRETSPERAAAVETLRLPGIGTKSKRRRYYPQGLLAGQVVGFSGIDTQGLEGIELQHDEALRGVPGSVPVQRDARGREILLMGGREVAPKHGATVQLTIDSNLQRIAEENLEEVVSTRGAAAGVALVMDPNTGEILAMANVPRADPNLGTDLGADARRNRAVTDRYEPGSTFKTILAAAAIEADVVWPHDKIDCENGRYAIGRRTITDHDPYGLLTFADVIRFSSNIGAAKVAEKLGAKRFEETIRSFGFGRRSGVDLPGEVAGTVRPHSEWRKINLATTAFGHGIDVTPLQVLGAYSAIANRGRLMRPYVVRRVVSAQGSVVLERSPEVVAEPISADTAKIVSELLEGVVVSGTATAAQIDGVRVAGKTGTARKIDKATGRYSHRQHIASFVGYFPAEAPRFAALVVIDSPTSGTYGGVVAAPVFRRIGDYLADKHSLRVAPPPAEIQPKHPDGVQVVRWAAEAEEGMPSYVGLSMRTAVSRAERAGWQVQTIGSGYVVAQEPPPGEKVISGRQLILRFAAGSG